MNESTKKFGAIVIAVAAVSAAAYGGYKLLAPTPLETGVVHASPPKSMAQLEKEKMQREDAAAATGQGAAAERNGEDPSATLAGGR